MNTDPSETSNVAHSLLPAWFTSRMMQDSWSFALLTVTGTTICIQSITNIVRAGDGTIWLDVILLEEGNSSTECFADKLVAPSTRLEASVNASNIVAAYELTDT